MPPLFILMLALIVCREFRGERVYISSCKISAISCLEVGGGREENSSPMHTFSLFLVCNVFVVERALCRHIRVSSPWYLFFPNHEIFASERTLFLLCMPRSVSSRIFLEKGGCVRGSTWKSTMDMMEIVNFVRLEGEFDFVRDNVRNSRIGSHCMYGSGKGGGRKCSIGKIMT